MPLEQVAIITNASQEDVIRMDLLKKNWEGISLWLEPVGRNTAAAVGLAAAVLAKRWPEGVLAVFPADHFIRDAEKLRQGLALGAHWAKQGYLVTFGIPPTKPETGYGYIECGPALDQEKSVFGCRRFIEKPALAKAQEFLAAGNYYWNSGMFMFRRDVIWDSLAKHLPELALGLGRLMESDNPPPLAAIYPELPSISLDHGVMEKANNVAVIPLEMGWSDVGTWGALYDLFPADAQGNVKIGRVYDLHSRDSLIFSQDRLVATLGLEGVIVVDTPDATLVCHRDRTQEVKDLVAELHRRQQAELINHTTVERPWGRYTVIDTGPGYKVKQIEVYPGRRLSLQFHNYRSEHWVVVLGTAMVTIGKDTKPVPANESVFIPPLTPHRLENATSEPLRLVEVQTGSYLEEDDIVRLGDDYWRLPT
jgi:mannose-1-phosphate guanylyltransferase/mannose-6-phosphate isomerase